jgi:hypothetical protein
MRVTRIFLLVFRNSFFFVYRHSDLEGSCSNGTKTRHGESRCCLRVAAGHEIWHWATWLETFTERNCWAYDQCAGEVRTEGGFTLDLFQGWGMGSEVLLEQVQLNFGFRNKFIILHPHGLLVENNIFAKICLFLKVLLATNGTMYVFFWVIPRCLNFIYRRFGTLCLFHLNRQVVVEWLNLRIVGVANGRSFGSKIAWANSKEGTE